MPNFTNISTFSLAIDNRGVSETRISMPFPFANDPNLAGDTLANITPNVSSSYSVGSGPPLSVTNLTLSGTTWNATVSITGGTPGAQLCVTCTAQTTGGQVLIAIVFVTLTGPGLHPTLSPVPVTVQNPGTFYGGPVSGPPAAPTFRQINDPDLSATHVAYTNVANTFTTGPQTFNATIALGPNPASTGDIRLHSAFGLLARNAGNTADLNILRTDVNDQILLGGNTWAPTAGTRSSILKQTTFAPTSGNAQFVGVHLNPTINATGAVSGAAYTAFAIAPVLTSIIGTTVKLLDLGPTTTDYFTGFTSKFSVDTSGNVVVAGNVTVTGAAGNVALLNAANTFTIAPQTITPNADTHSALALNSHSATQSAALLSTQVYSAGTLLLMTRGEDSTNQFSIQRNGNAPYLNSYGTILYTSTDFSPGGKLLMNNNQIATCIGGNTSLTFSSTNGITCSTTSASVVPFIINTAANPIADILDLKINDSLVTKFDPAGRLTCPQANIIGTSDIANLNIRAVSGQTSDFVLFQGPHGEQLTEILIDGSISSHGQAQHIFGRLAVPTGFAAGSPTAGGTFAAGTYYWVMTSTNSAGETVQSSEVSQTVTLNQEVPLSWTQSAGATGYKIYRSTTSGVYGATSLVTTISDGTVTNYTDTGTATSAGTPPTAPTGSKVVIQGWKGQNTPNLQILNSVGAGGMFFADSGNNLQINTNGSNQIILGSNVTMFNLGATAVIGANSNTTTINFQMNASGVGTNAIQMIPSGSTLATLKLTSANLDMNGHTIISNAPGNVSCTISTAASPSADILDLQNNGNLVTYVDKSGNIGFNVAGLAIGGLNNNYGYIQFNSGNIQIRGTSANAVIAEFDSHNVSITIPGAGGGGAGFAVSRTADTGPAGSCSVMSVTNGSGQQIVNQNVGIITKVATVTNKALTSNVVTLTTAANHNFKTNETVVVAIGDSIFNGTFTVTGTPTGTTFTYSVIHADVASQAASGTATVAQSADLEQWMVNNALATSFNAKGLVGTYNQVATAGLGVPAIYAAGRSTAQTAAVASVASYTVGSSDGSFRVSANVNVTAYTAGTFTVTTAYTDETNTARTLTLNFTNVGGAIGTAIAAAGVFDGITANIRAKANTSIAIATTGTFTNLTYNVEGLIEQHA